jgi:hypothetical protein
MARAVLGSRCDRPSASHPMLALDPACGCDSDVCGSTDEPTPLPPLTGEIRRRTRYGFDDEGTPLFRWDTIAESPIVVIESRNEFDAESGQTSVMATVTMTCAEKVTETATLACNDDTVWRVIGVNQVGAACTLKLVRIDQTPTGQVGS